MYELDIIGVKHVLTFCSNSSQRVQQGLPVLIDRGIEYYIVNPE